MTVEDALRKIALLRKISTDSGALAAEAENAYRLQKALMARYAIKPQYIPDGAPTAAVSQLSWTYWKEVVEQFGLTLTRLGNRGSVAVGNAKLFIKLEKNQWWVEERSPNGWQTTARDRGMESLRKYLFDHAPKTYSFLRR